jgi:hypothetical protein
MGNFSSLGEAPRPQGGASRARSGEQNASKGSFVHIVPPVAGSYRLDPAGHVPVKTITPKKSFPPLRSIVPVRQ